MPGVVGGWVLMGEVWFIQGVVVSMSVGLSIGGLLAWLIHFHPNTQIREKNASLGSAHPRR